MAVGLKWIIITFLIKLKIIHSPIKEVDVTLIWVGVVLSPPPPVGFPLITQKR